MTGHRRCGVKYISAGIVKRVAAYREIAVPAVKTEFHCGTTLKYPVAQTAQISGNVDVLQISHANKGIVAKISNFVSQLYVGDIIFECRPRDSIRGEVVHGTGAENGQNAILVQFPVQGVATQI